jgi:hypothetical protein
VTAAAPRLPAKRNLAERLPSNRPGIVVETVVAVSVTVTSPNTTRIGGPRASRQHRRQHPARGNEAGRHLRSGEISGAIDQPSWSTGQELAWQRCAWRAACRVLAPGSVLGRRGTPPECGSCIGPATRWSS